MKPRSLSAATGFMSAVTWMAAMPAAFALDPSRAISQYGHTAWTLQDGLLPGAPTDIAQTRDGYLWIGTRTGLVRFDGVRFVPFVPPAGTALHSSRILSLKATSDGSLWIGSRAHLERWHNGKLTHYPDAPGSISSILEDRAGKVWFTRMSLRDDKGPLCEVAGERTRCHGTAAGIPLDHGRQLDIDPQGNFWAVSDNTLMRWQGGSARTWLPPGVTKSGEVVDVLQSVLPAKDGSVWVGAMQPSRGLGLLRLVDDELQPFVIPGLDGRKLSVSRMLLDRDGALWVGTQDEGVYRLHDGRVSHYRAAHGLSSDTIQNLFEDREGTIWVLTTRGIDAFRNLRIVSVTSAEGLSADLANAVLAARDGTIWINAWHSLDALRDGKISSLNARNGLPGEEVTALFEDRAGTLWVGVDDDLTVFEGGRFKAVGRSDGSPIGIVRGLTQDSSGDVWVVAPDGLVRIRDRRVVEQVPRSAVPFRYGVIVADPREGIWLPLTNGDLGRYRNSRLESVEFHRPPDTGLILGLVAYPDGAIVGNTSLGLIGWRDGKSQTMTAETNGLPCNEVHTLLNDERGALWLYATCGIVFIGADQLRAWWQDPSARLTFRVFDAIDGAQPARGNFFPPAARGPDGKLWFANASVVQMIDPDRLTGNTLAPAVHVEQVVADRTPFLLQAGLRLPPHTRELQIDYTGLSLVVPRKTSFRYRLDGHDTEWHEAGARRQAFYTDLPPGSYRFHVTASNNDGVWNERGTSLSFSIAPAFYQTRWFMALCVAAGVGALWLLYLLRVRQIETRLRMRLEERLMERERIARELHDTLLQGLLSASLQLSVANSQIPRDAPAKSLVERILQLLRQVIDEGRNAVRDLRTRDPERDALERALAQVPQDLAMDEKVQFRLLVEGAPQVLRAPIRDEVYRIGREALANAFRHARASAVEAVLEYTPERFRMVVRDNGCGMDPDVLQSGREGHWGLSGIRERATKIGAKLKVLSAPEAGTEIDLVVPGGAAFETSAARRWSDWLGRLYLRSEKE